ncbi:MAG: hypothetical protein HQK52_09205 [Oligoflexia bacterium]|nr:hypothetical protein [Oligoflexia bacterium]
MMKMKSRFLRKFILGFSLVLGLNLNLIMAAEQQNLPNTVLQPLSPFEQGVCRTMRRDGARNALIKLTLSGSDCEQILNTFDALASERLKQVADPQGANLLQRCFLAGYREGVVTGLQNTLEFCLSTADLAAKAGYVLGRTICFLQTKAYPVIILQLTAETERGDSGYDPKKFIFTTDPTIVWGKVLEHSSSFGFAAGCLMGENDYVNGKSYSNEGVIVEDKDLPCYAGDKVGSALGKAYGGSFTPDLQAIATAVPQAVQADFLKGLQQGWNRGESR